MFHSWKHRISDNMLLHSVCIYFSRKHISEVSMAGIDCAVWINMPGVVYEKTADEYSKEGR